MAESLGIKRIEALRYVVHDLERSRRFYAEKMDFAETAASTPEQEEAAGERSLLFEADEVRILCTQPLREDSRAGRYLAQHPDGVSEVLYQVGDAKKAFELLESRGGTPVIDVHDHRVGDQTLTHFAITTPFGDTQFRFIERTGPAGVYEGMERYAEPRGGKNRFGFTHIDHLTSNFRTMKPMLLWLEHVMGAERFWDVEFHTEDVATQPHEGSGLRSVVMWIPEGLVKFANNEPRRPHFDHSQIAIFVDENRGEGIQHAALASRDLVETVKGLRSRGVEFMPTPGTYYDALPDRLQQMGIGTIDEDLDELRNLEILVDGEGKDSYLIQIFLKDAAGLYDEPQAGPFFYELIQRKGDEGFGAGNFRALFESIEREQVTQRRGQGSEPQRGQGSEPQRGQGSERQSAAQGREG